MSAETLSDPASYFLPALADAGVSEHEAVIMAEVLGTLGKHYAEKLAGHGATPEQAADVVAGNFDKVSADASRLFAGVMAELGL